MIKGDKVILRPLDLGDVDDMVRRALDTELSVLGGWQALGSIEDRRARYEKRIKDPPDDIVSMAIEVDSKLIGNIDLYDIDWRQQRGEIGIEIDKPYWGKGYGKDAVITLLQYVFLVKNIRKVIGESYDFNKASIALFRSVGFTQEGLLRSHEFTTGAFRDMYLFGMLRDEFLERYPARRFSIPT